LEILLVIVIFLFVFPFDLFGVLVIFLYEIFTNPRIWYGVDQDRNYEKQIQRFFNRKWWHLC
jgi:hypothetical protein